MAILVDTDGNGTWDKEKNDLTVSLPQITDETSDGKLDVNLTTAHSSAVINGAIFADAANVGSGTGNYNTFLAIQDQAGNQEPDDYEQGFNSDDTNPLDGTNYEIDHAKTETLLLGAVPIKIVDNVAYYEFRVDLNESNSAPDTNISLDQFKLYTSTNPDIESTTQLFGDAALRYDMDANDDISVLLSEANSSGSGNDDYAVLVPVSNFAGLNPATTYLYLYVEMGRADGTDWITQGGFEEWNLQNAIIIQGTKFLDSNGNGVQDNGEGGMAGVTIFIDDDLDGVVEATDNNGVLDAGEQSTVTDSNGYYSFGGIPLYDTDYTIAINEVVPPGTVPTTDLPIYVTIDKDFAAGTVFTVDPIGNRLLVPDFTVAKVVSSITGGYMDGGGVWHANSAGDVVNYTITIDNTGEVALTGFNYTDLNANGDAITYVSGDTHNAGVLDTDEVWVYSATHTVTQPELDSTGTASSGALDTDGDTDNTVSVDFNEVGPKEASAVSLLDASPALSILKTITSVTGGVDSTGAVNVNPALNTWADSDGDIINYSVVVANAGNVSLTGVDVSDLLEGADLPEGTVTESIHADGVLEVGETWTYGFSYTVDQEDIDRECATGDEQITNAASVGAYFHNTLVTAGPSTVYTPVLCDPSIDVEKYVSVNNGSGYGAFEDADNPQGPLASVNADAYFKVVITNTGNVSLTGVTLSDYQTGPTSHSVDYSDPSLNAYIDLNGNGTEDAGEDYSVFDTDGDGTLDAGSVAILSPNESFTLYYTLPFESGQHTNTVTVTTTQGATDADAANYYGFIQECSGVRTPGFWSNWGSFWDGVSGNEPKQAGTPGFADGELVYAVDSNGDHVIDGADRAGLLIGDYNQNGVTDLGEDTLFISLNDARTLINATQKQQQNGAYMLGRDVVATWLNFLADNAVGDSSDPHSPAYFLDQSVDWFQQFDSDANNAAVTQAKFEFDAPTKTSSSNWQSPVSGVTDVSAATIHSQLDAYNNTGIIDGIEYACDADNSVALYALAQIA